MAWSGRQEAFLDRCQTSALDAVVLGQCGGSATAGASTNEDGALVFVGADWTFAMLLDGHASAESVDLLIDVFQEEAETIATILDGDRSDVFEPLETHLLRLFRSDHVRARCQAAQGETACLICVERGGFLWWLSVGDCLVYVLHPDFAKLGQYALNSRTFFQWIGQVNTFDLPVPCYSRGVCELRNGWNRIVLVTDGLLECGSRMFSDPMTLSDWFTRQEGNDAHTLEAQVGAALRHVQAEAGRDSATVLAWDAYSGRSASLPTR
ncbi:MAG TPA: protein phosphatase 2C domain-containing protein [Ktedonobacterales bacterium]|nr:protein phosphatase 2C domain-containing protein [Ktedonobacterales bacterium]